MADEKGPPASLDEALRAGPKIDILSPHAEEEILSFWKENDIFNKSIEARKKGNPFVFYEGPPTANGKPGAHHVEARSFKDIVLRYKTMRGLFVPRRAGWDTHGLPVEVEVEKKLGLKSKKDIEQYGVAAFNQKCKESVWEYRELWEKLTDRMGFWIDMAHPYVTYENSYIESLWGVIKKFSDKKLLYEDLKVVPWCARCGTALSSHELAQGYEKVKEESIYVKFPLADEKNIFLLVWTTTPWTLPGNVALAVNPEVSYAVMKKGEERLIIAEARVSILPEGYTPEKNIFGKDLIGKTYEPLYPNSAPYKIIAGDFVGAEEGSGIVHIAPAFGEDDFQMAKPNDLPILVTTEADGLMRAPGQPWDGAWFKKADPMIIADLEGGGLLLKKEIYEHDYPFCWRCKNPLMYFARKTWWVDVNAVREKLIANNQTINWYPEHLKDGRFGEWLKEKKNWAFSRERYWGTPLPVWRCPDCQSVKTVGTLEDLDKNDPNPTTIIFMRHGEAMHNVSKITTVDPKDDGKDGLTEKGKQDALAQAKKLKKEKIDVIVASTAYRAKQTAEIVQEELGIGPVTYMPELYEIMVTGFANAPLEEYRNSFANEAARFIEKPRGAENLRELRARMMQALGEIKKKYSGKTILVISHGDPMRVAMCALEGLAEAEYQTIPELLPGATSRVRLHNWPYNTDGELDLHKPYIDEIKLRCVCGNEMQRVPEVVDVWFDSGSMPFAAGFYPDAYPADYIVEAVDQTRGWFYNLLAVSTLLDQGTPYKNVISLGHLLDKEGKKMSKSLGNIVDPMMIMEKYGADPVRWYFFTVNQPGDSKLFKEEDVRDAHRRFFMILLNSFKYWQTYGVLSSLVTKSPQLVINKWLLSKWNEVLEEVTEKLDTYDIVGAARLLENFVVEDLSHWYIRRIRGHMKQEGSLEAAECSAVLGFVLLELSKALAPFVPFIAEGIYKSLSQEKMSVHLEDFPTLTKASEGTAKLMEQMDQVRGIVTQALEARQKAGIKIRQPLAKLQITNDKLQTELLDLIKGEVNVKQISFGEKLDLDAALSDELKEEGLVREFLRQVQDFRKELKLKPQEKMKLTVDTDDELKKILETYRAMIEKEISISKLSFGSAAGDKKEISLGDKKLEIGIQ